MNKNHTAKILLLLLTSFVLTFSSCKKDEDEPDYAGTWSTVYDFLGTEMKDVLKLTSNSFEMISKMKDPQSSTYVDLMGVKGTLSAKSDKLTFVINAIGVINPLTGTLQYIKKGEEGYDDFIDEYDVDENFTAKYQVSGNQLTLSYDDDGNGIYGDENDSVETYTRE